MDARQHWQALQSRLTAARAAFEQGDRQRALAEIDAALQIDPSFLAAAALRDQIVAAHAVAANHRPSPAGQRAAVPDETAPVPRETAPATETVAAPLVSTERYAKFEQRARRRRVDRKIEAARDAIARKNLRAAASALDEVIDLDPNLPDLSQLTAEFDELRRERATSHRGPTVAAAVAFGAVLLGASWIHEGGYLLSHPFAAAARLVDARTPEPIDVPTVDAGEPLESVAPVATSGRRDVRLPTPERTPIVSSPAAAPVRMPEPPPPPPTVATPAPSLSGTAPTAAGAVVSNVPPVPVTNIAAAVDVPRPSMPPPSRTESDEAQIARALQQYRAAYEELDAKRAQAVWPAVNQTALARAFDSLASQSLTFDACRTQLHGDSAVATCQGSARYVPKIGSREPHVEPRTWTFLMRRTGGEWKIDTARAER